MYKVVARSGRKETVWQPYASREEAEAKLVALRAEKIPGIGPKARWSVQKESAHERLTRFFKEAGLKQVGFRGGRMHWVEEHTLHPGITLRTQTFSYDPYDAERILRDIDRMGRDEFMRRLKGR
jgi:hypothetical protein